ncbi:hypothetical protein T265_10782 [Opisthorchis viverrini]|uniref:Homeobox domain-containing protein n=1 Tax=Opisthorchis viverrini TaxID=6198 RepID=A0A074Z197_OPIVI|nr:hypothetical protein T265_10782 [Opisthorchis viverrini]KER20728.1 hypothetical protein T265_10782 [Opisthorchis viverrini]
MNFLTLSTLVHDKERAIRFLQSQGVFYQQRLCNNGRQMTLPTVPDRWRCNVQQCRQDIGLRKGTWLEGSRMDFRTVILFIYCCLKNLAKIKFCSEELSISHTTGVLTGRTFFVKFAPGGFCRLQQLSAGQVYTPRSMKRYYLAVKTWFQNRRMKHKKMKRGYVSSGQDTQQSLPLSGKRDGNPNYPATCGTNSSCSGTEDLEYERSRKVENFLCLPPSPTSSASASETYVNLEAVQSETWRAKRQIVLDTLRNPPSKKESKSLVVSSEADVSIPVKCRISEYESAQSGKDLMTSCGVTRDASEFDDIKSSVFNPKFLMQHYFLNCPISWGGVTKLSSG